MRDDSIRGLLVGLLFGSVGCFSQLLLGLERQQGGHDSGRVPREGICVPPCPGGRGEQSWRRLHHLFPGLLRREPLSHFRRLAADSGKTWRFRVLIFSLRGSASGRRRGWVGHLVAISARFWGCLRWDLLRGLARHIATFLSHTRRLKRLLRHTSLKYSSFLGSGPVTD